MSSRRTGGAAANGFYPHILLVEEARLLYANRYPCPPGYRPPSCGWKLAANGVAVPPVPRQRSEAWFDEICSYRRALTPAERASPMWDVQGNDAHWIEVFRARRDEDLACLDGLIGAPSQKNAISRDMWWVCQDGP